MRTWMCDNGHHGTTERRKHADYGFTYRGECAGMCYSMLTGEETECDCECHDAASTAVAGRMEQLIEAARGVAREFGGTVWVALYSGPDATGDEQHEVYYERPDALAYADVHEVKPDGSVDLV